MDILNILEQLKQKGLDVVQIELLKSAYELQNRNIEQLKDNNDALRESHQLLKEKVTTLEKENEVLKNEFKALPIIKSDDAISEIGRDVLKRCVMDDVIQFNSDDMIANLSQYTRIQVETGIGELRSHSLIIQSGVIGYGRGAKYRLTQHGMKYCSLIK